MSTLLICAYLKRAINLSTEKKRLHNKWKIVEKKTSLLSRMTLRFGKLPKTTVRHWLSCQQQWKYPSTRTISDLPSSSPLPPHLTLSFCLVFVSVSVSVSVSVFASISSPVCDLRFTSFVFSLLDAKWVLYHIVIYCYMLRWCDRLCTEISDLLAVALGCTLEAGLAGFRLA